MRTATSRYFDAASGLPLHPVGLEAFNAALEDGWADPRRLSGEARRAARLLDAARGALAEQLRVEPDELSFTASGIAATHAAVLGSVAGRARHGRRLVHSAVEHSAVLHAAGWHTARGGEVEVVPVDGQGRVDADAFVVSANAPGVAAAVLQTSNHEVGTRQPLAEVARALKDTTLVADATHELRWGTPAALDGVSVFTGDARIWGGPSGVGLLVVRRGTRWIAPFPTDDNEFGRSAGGVNIPAIVAAAASLRAQAAEAASDAERLRGYVDRMRTQVPQLVDDCAVLGDPRDRLPHILTFSCLYVDGEALLTELGRRDFTVSSGSSCTSDSLTPSHVLAAMGALTSGNVRVSLHPGVGDDDIDAFLDALPEVVRATRAHLPAGSPAGEAALHQTGARAGRVLDSRGKRCPLPILDLAKAWPEVPIGGEITVLSDDPAAATDIAAWARMRGQKLVEATSHDESGVAYRVRRLT